ncbi:MAG: iron-sulfur cluster assembly accessory protein [Limnochordales bacterium]|jgi:Iron-sulfur cluster assembly accessory protein|nr:iron-sulfur cluster assembly accessory protein [Bacillota bacterium]
MVTVTLRAADKLKEIMEAENRQGQALRIVVKRGGCSGYSYALGFDSEEREDDIVSEQHGIRVLVDRESMRFLAGTEIDYVETLMGAGFAINNPNAVRTCGCGHSFRTADDEGEPQLC